MFSWGHWIKDEVKMHWISFHQKRTPTLLMQRTPTNPGRLCRFCSLVHLWSIFRCTCQKVIAKNFLCLNFWNGRLNIKIRQQAWFLSSCSTTCYLFTFLKLESDVMIWIWLIQHASNLKIFFTRLNTLFIAKFHTVTSKTA